MDKVLRHKLIELLTVFKNNFEHHARMSVRFSDMRGEYATAKKEAWEDAATLLKEFIDKNGGVE